MSQKPGHNTGPKGDVSYVRATPGPQYPIAPSPLPSMDNNHLANAHPQQHNVNSDLEDKLELQQRELEEIRARAAQMEKTMRWWSDCTSNWREKWSKVRNERNKAREENRQLRGKLDLLIKENNSLKRDKDELVNSSKITVGKTDKLQDKNVESMTGSTSCASALGVSKPQDDIETRSDTSNSDSVQSKLQSPARRDVLTDSECQTLEDLRDLRQHSDKEEEVGGERLTLIELKLDESQKTISGEREEKTHLLKLLEDTRHELLNLKTRYEEQKQSKLDLEMQLERVREQHGDDLARVTSDLQDEQATRAHMDKRVAELRAELEKLQRENADEWGRRERLETEKLGIERENKKLRATLSDMEEQLERKSTHASTVVNKDMKTLQLDVSERNKELADLKHIHVKLKKAHQERLTDLDHSRRRCDQFEMEVKKLRSRVEELKRELANAEDEVDTQGNNVRKVQRTNDELQEQVENLNVQLEHLQSRLRRSSQSNTGHGGSLRAYSPNLQALEVDDDTDDDFSEGS
ncbi:C102A-like protein [Mya arenaria]|uniref:Coiled-coil domain-containing protein 102A n=1 Tax=Mya arenaria TaxID=6604 RepID=A0ABY7ET94_MYAAR|nr:coiled-coil domain-containing protein 102A-like [Mya arenaria]XP_052819327.1 coiled-coil domain-containing protein 102A-like [Mya arenaria]WAR13205.1 C102A-like protein [Mya arenaria]